MQDIVSGITPKPLEQSGTSRQAQDKPGRKAPQASAQGSTEVTPPKRTDRKPQAKIETKEPVSLDELAAMLRKVNLTFDLFEIAAEYSVVDNGHRVTIVVHNTRTGEVLRRIPPVEFVANFNDIRHGLGMQLNASV